MYSFERTRLKIDFPRKIISRAQAAPHISLREGNAPIKPFGAKTFPALFSHSTHRALPHRIFLIFLASVLVVIRFFPCVFLRAQAKSSSPTTRRVCSARIYFRKAARAAREDNFAPYPTTPLFVSSRKLFLRFSPLCKLRDRRTLSRPIDSPDSRRVTQRRRARRRGELRESCSETVFKSQFYESKGTDKTVFPITLYKA